MVATSVSGAVQPALCSHAPNLSTTKAVKRAPTVARGPTPCGAPHGDRGNGLEFPVSVPLLDHEEFPILQAPGWLRHTGGRRARSPEGPFTL